MCPGSITGFGLSFHKWLILNHKNFTHRYYSLTLLLYIKLLRCFNSFFFIINSLIDHFLDIILNNVRVFSRIVVVDQLVYVVFDVIRDESKLAVDIIVSNTCYSRFS